MDAIEMLESQHREVEALFSKIGKARDAAKKTTLFEELADKLAMHAAIEEHHFYPAVKAKRTEDILLESLEEHLGIKRVLADLLDLPAGDETFDAKIKVLNEQVSHHVKEEETDLFPKSKKVLDLDERKELAKSMQAEQARLEAKGTPRKSIPGETDAAAPLT
jgi:hemerythrin superfamily protein